MPGAWKRNLFVAAASFALACQTQDQASEQGSATDPAVDEAAVREAIEANDAAFEAAFSTGDVVGVAGFYTPDAVVMIPNGPRVDGSAAIEETFTGMLQGFPGAALDLTTRDVHVAAAGDYAYATGSYTLGGTTPDGAEWNDAGKYVAVWRNLDGTWKMAADIWNSDTPLPADAAAADPGTIESGEPAE
jgi:uncharacterized protein (TIGR02246 family)